MKFTGYVTSRYNSTRVPLKAIQKVNGKTLVDRVIRCLAQVPEVEDILLYGDCPSIKSYTPVDDYRFVQRPIELSGDDVTFEQILDNALPYLDTDYIVFMTYTAPFFRPETVSAMIQQIIHTSADSAFAVTKHKEFTWISGKPIYQGIPKTQDLAPVYFETSNIYIFKKEYYEKTKKRIGVRPHMHVVDKIEGWDIDTMADLKIAQYIGENEDETFSRPSGVRRRKG